MAPSGDQAFAASCVRILSDDSSIFYRHRCPICQQWHWVNAVTHHHAYGRQVTCCVACEMVRRQHWWHFQPRHSG